MYRNKRFTARFSPEDQNLLVHLAARLRRTKSDTVRILIYEKAVELDLYPGPVKREPKIIKHHWDK